MMNSKPTFYIDSYGIKRPAAPPDDDRILMTEYIEVVSGDYADLNNRPPVDEALEKQIQLARERMDNAEPGGEA